MTSYFVTFRNVMRMIRDRHERPHFPYAAIRLTEGEDTRTFCHSGLKPDDSLDESLIVTSTSSPNVGHNPERGRPRDNYTVGQELLDFVLGI